MGIEDSKHLAYDTFKRRNIILFSLTLALSVLSLSVVWEFFLEDLLMSKLFVNYALESGEEKNRFVITISLFVIISLIFPTFYLLKVMKQLNVSILENRELERELVRMEKMKTMALFSGGVAHNFNNILTVVLGSLSLLESEIRTDQNQMDFNAIRQAVILGAGISDKLLQFYRKEPQQIEEIDLGLLIEQFCGDLGLARPDLNIALDFQGNGLRFTGSTSLTHQAFSNVLINAVEAMPNGGEIKVEVKRVKLEGSIGGLSKQAYIQISVVDQGPGMTAEEMKHIYDPFFTTKELGQGLGLGLTLALWSMELQNGNLTVESQRGQGSRFNLFFPVNSNGG